MFYARNTAVKNHLINLGDHRMRHIHLILEVYCLHGMQFDGYDDSNIPKYCKYGVEKPGYHCMENRCHNVAYAPAPHEIAFAVDNGEVPHNAWIGFGGDMEPDNLSLQETQYLKKLWEEICIDNINKSYNDYKIKVDHLDLQHL